jgi:DNA-directed RNA polymerase subunit F
MVKPEIIKETALTMSELRDEIEKIKKKSEKLNFRAEKTEEYLNQFAILDSKKSAELK